jgi:hypothetical protein
MLLVVFALGFVYGICFLYTLAYFVLLIAVSHIEWVGVIPELGDSLELFVLIPQMLGVVRTGLFVLIALAWPLLLVLFGLLFVFYRRKDWDAMPSPIRRILSWTFLGLGKFTPRTLLTQ